MLRTVILTLLFACSVRPFVIQDLPLPNVDEDASNGYADRTARSHHRVPLSPDLVDEVAAQKVVVIDQYKVTH